LRYWAALAAVKYGSKNIRKGGSIVLTTGVAGQRPHKGWVVAASVCGTIEALTRALALELAPIRVNAVSPGVVRTNLWQNMTAAEREQLYESVGNSLPVGRVGEPHDIAQAYLFLMQEGFGTGQTLVVDGGTVLV
jgi:NAD(P)-dependent dehydrogenase (short-subunit alcohol dehydrogenase family)